MSQENSERVLSLREQIKNNTDIQELLDGGMTHETILAELEDMIEDEYGFNKIIATAEQALTQEGLGAEDKEKYERMLKYCTQVREMNGDEYDI